MTDHPPASPDPARSFGQVAAAYERARPTYPREAAAWLVGDSPVTVLELGAGTGKLTEVLVGLGHDVHATDPDEQMLAVLRDRLPDVRTSVAAAEDIPAPDASYDVVVVAQAFHWFDHDRALAEIARVLKPHGRLSVAWNARDERIPWVRKLGRIIANPVDVRSEDVLVASPLFGFVEEQSFRFWQVVDRDSIQDLVTSRSSFAVLEEEARAARVAEVVAFYDDYGRGMDGMQLPYVCRCFRTTVVERAASAPQPEDGAGEAGEAEAGEDERRGERAVEQGGQGLVSDDGSDADVLLIDFR